MNAASKYIKEFMLVDDRILHCVPLWKYRDLTKALKHRVDAIVDPLLAPNCHGWRNHYDVHTAVKRIEAMGGERLSCDITNFFPSINQKRLKHLVSRYDHHLWLDVEPFMPEGGYGLPEGCAFSPPLANLYLTALDDRWPEMTRYGDNIMLCCDNPAPKMDKLKRQLRDIDLFTHPMEADIFCKQRLTER